MTQITLGEFAITILICLAVGIPWAFFVNWVLMRLRKYTDK